MTGFTTWDILRNLLLAARWTVALSLIAFLGGFLLGGGLCCCACPGGAGPGAPPGSTSSCSRARRC